MKGVGRDVRRFALDPCPLAPAPARPIMRMDQEQDDYADDNRPALTLGFAIVAVVAWSGLW